MKRDGVGRCIGKWAKAMLAACLLLPTTGAAPVADRSKETARRPNILFIMIDDMCEIQSRCSDI